MERYFEGQSSGLWDSGGQGCCGWCLEVLGIEGVCLLELQLPRSGVSCESVF